MFLVRLIDMTFWLSLKTKVSKSKRRSFLVDYFVSRLRQIVQNLTKSLKISWSSIKYGSTSWCYAR